MFLKRFHKPHPKSQDGKLSALLARHGIRTVIDVGGNIGQTHDRLRILGYSGRVVSIEPIARLQAHLVERAAKDPAWIVLPPMALSDHDGIAELLVAKADDLSSLRPALDSLRNTLPKAETIARETVRVRRLDDLWPQIDADPKTTLLKIDAQGSEAEILRGASRTVQRLAAVLIELSLQPLYDGEADYLEICSMLHAAGFTPVLFIPGYFSRSQCRLLQMDGLFVRHPVL